MDINISFDKMKPKEKVIKYLKRLIHQTRILSKEKDFPYTKSYDLWKRRVELFLKRVCGDKIADEFKNIVKDKPQTHRSFRDETLEQYLNRSRKENKEHHELALLKTKNLLKAAKEDIELFELDKEVKIEAEKIRRKYQEIEIGVPGIKYKRGKEVVDQ